MVFLLLDGISITVWYHPLASFCKTISICLCHLHSVSLRHTKNFHSLTCVPRRGFNCKNYSFGASCFLCFKENYHTSCFAVVGLYLALIFNLMDILLLPTGWKITFLLILPDLVAELHYQITKFTKLIITKLLTWLLNTLGYLHKNVEETSWMNLSLIAVNFVNTV